MKRFNLLPLIFLSFFLTVVNFGQQPDFAARNNFYIAFKSRLDAQINQAQTNASTVITQKATARNTLQQNLVAELQRQTEIVATRAELLRSRQYMQPTPNAVQYYNTQTARLNQEQQRNTQAISNIRQRLGVAETEWNNALTNYMNVVKASVKDASFLESAYNQWMDDKSEPSWKKLAILIAGISNSRNIKTNVIVTKPPNTTIKYQAIDGGQVQTLQVGNASFTIGFYHFWLERPGQQPTAPRLVELVSLQKSIALN